MIASFVGFLVAITLVGISSARRSRGTGKDYYIADSSIAPWLVGLSAVATNNSGYMFIGVIGYTYVTGFPAIWLMLGWILGDYLGSMFVHARLREAAARTGQVSYAGVLSHWYGPGPGQGTVQRVIGLISLVFLLTYAGAQLVAGSKALHVLLGWPDWMGAVVGAVLVALYCLAGGIRASIWTDAVQSFIMIVAMALLLVVTVNALGGPAAALHDMQQIPDFTRWTLDNPVLGGVGGAVIFLVGWMFAGFSVIGQPHVMVRFMTLNDGALMNRARLWYYLWFTAFYAAATAVGLLSRIYLGESANFDAELALPTMASELLPPVLAGLILAGIFAATMSTADSLILSCSAAITHDFLAKPVHATYLIKLTTLGITTVALLLALSNSQSVFNLVILSWSGLASAFGPLLLALCLGYRPTQTLSLLALGGGLATALIWRWLGWHSFCYEGMPGILVGLLVLYLGTRLSPASDRLDAQAVDGPAA